MMKIQLIAPSMWFKIYTSKLICLFVSMHCCTQCIRCGSLCVGYWSEFENDEDIADCPISVVQNMYIKTKLFICFYVLLYTMHPMWVCLLSYSGPEGRGGGRRGQSEVTRTQGHSHQV